LLRQEWLLLSFLPSTSQHYLEVWLHGKKLTINLIKTLLMLVGSPHSLGKITSNASEFPCIMIGDTNVGIVHSTKHLGFMLDQHLA